MNSLYHIELTEKYGAHNYKPLKVVLTRGEGVWVWDVEGNKYIDMLSSYSALNQGHRHPKIINAIIEQLNNITLTSRAFYNDKLSLFLKKLNEITGYDKALPMNSGAEAVETALKIARKWAYTKKGIPLNDGEIIVALNNFHGRTITIISFSSEKQYRYAFGPFTPGFVFVPFGDEKAIERVINERTIGVLIEPIQGEGGIIVPPDGYLKKLREITKEKGVLLILDEIQTGLGRTGKLFAYQHELSEDEKPDILILGKALGGGVYPVSVVLANDNIMEVIKPGDHGSTFGGNPLASIIGITSIEVIIEENLPENARIMGEYFIKNLREIKSPYIKEVRGKGLLIGVELNKPAREFCERLLELGVLSKETHDYVIRFAPPLIIKREEIDWALERIEAVLSK
ncbi:MAG: ornithine--oxo-acid transaminase [candidate division WOR-3 bacterium]|nr:ornithine--oxo-acid transaminase [candidate division WOR-3 bacterium]MCX7947627.1 ornithine--oxo-acid transaminase [candidate division WOR-3 bacterium]MDW8150505.1 ornithine--oxo-acid transaminase [candidate division WOR-3 bacterium]